MVSGGQYSEPSCGTRRAQIDFVRAGTKNARAQKKTPSSVLARHDSGCQKQKDDDGQAAVAGDDRGLVNCRSSIFGL